VSEFVQYLVIGVVTGSIYAVSASGLVVTYNATGIFNFAYGAVGMFLAYLYWQLWQGWGWSPLLSLAIVLLVLAPLLALLVERVLMRPLHGSTLNTQIVVTLGLFLLLYGLTGTIWNQSITRNLPEWLAGDQVDVFNVNLTYEQLITVGCAVLVAGSLWYLFRHTRMGVSMRAVVDDPSLASMTGARSGRIAGLAWIIGFMAAGLAGILVAPGTGMSLEILSELVIFGYAAAIVGRLRSLPLTYLGAMILGISGSLAIGYVPGSALNDVTNALPMGLLIIVLLLLPQGTLTAGRLARHRPPRTPSLRTTLISCAVLIAVSTVLTFVITGTNLYTEGLALASSIAALSLVLLSGYGGQAWLCQFTFMGIGAWAMSKVDGGNSVLGVLVAVGLCAVAGGILALPALRLRSLYMALATLAFAVLMDEMFFTNPSVVSGGSISVGRPRIFGLTFATDRSFVIFMSVVLAVCIVGVGVVRRGTFGRRLVAMSDSQVACATMGMSITITKLAAFVIAGGLAGLAGVLYGGMERTVSVTQFGFVESLVLFVAVVLAGVTMLSASVQAGVSLAVITLIGQHLSSFSGFTYVLFGVGIIAVGRNPYRLGQAYERLGHRIRARAGKTSGPGSPPGSGARDSTPPMGPAQEPSVA
jgi:branched-chain amino acid transport system permease protein